VTTYKSNGLGKLYDIFTTSERFALVIEALARGDDQEARQLVRSCPRHNYNIIDAAYTDRMSTADSIVQAVALDLVPRIAKAKMIEACEEALRLTYNYCANEALDAYFVAHRAGAVWAWEKAGMEGVLPKDTEEGEHDETQTALLEARIQADSERVANDLKKLKLKVATEALAMWEAFSTFCREELGLGPEKPVKVFFEPLLSEVEVLLYMTEGVVADQREIDRYRQLITSGWQR
jgi:hypothetical protein